MHCYFSEKNRLCCWRRVVVVSLIYMYICTHAHTYTHTYMCISSQRYSLTHRLHLLSSHRLLLISAVPEKGGDICGQGCGHMCLVQLTTAN